MARKISTNDKRTTVSLPRASSSRTPRQPTANSPRKHTRNPKEAPLPGPKRKIDDLEQSSSNALPSSKNARTKPLPRKASRLVRLPINVPSTIRQALPSTPGANAQNPHGQNRVPRPESKVTASHAHYNATGSKSAASSSARGRKLLSEGSLPEYRQIVYGMPPEVWALFNVVPYAAQLRREPVDVIKSTIILDSIEPFLSAVDQTDACESALATVDRLRELLFDMEWNAHSHGQIAHWVPSTAEDPKYKWRAQYTHPSQKSKGEHKNVSSAKHLSSIPAPTPHPQLEQDAVQSDITPQFACYEAGDDAFYEDLQPSQPQPCTELDDVNPYAPYNADFDPMIYPPCIPETMWEDEQWLSEIASSDVYLELMKFGSTS